jgi:hypothetical protein
MMEWTPEAETWEGIYIQLKPAWHSSKWSIAPLSLTVLKSWQNIIDIFFLQGLNSRKTKEDLCQN